MKKAIVLLIIASFMSCELTQKCCSKESSNSVCNKCGKNSCDTTCSSNPSLQKK